MMNIIQVMQVEAFMLITLNYMPVNCLRRLRLCYLIQLDDNVEKGYYQCDKSVPYLTGFEREALLDFGESRMKIRRRAECCIPPDPWSELNDIIVDYVNWIHPLLADNQWVYCPLGYFLGGIYTSGSFPGKFSEIEAGRCIKPADHPNYYKHCYEHNTSSCNNEEGLCECEYDYYVVGLLKGDCYGFLCMNTLKCCRMADKPEELTDLYKVKLRVMSRTRRLAAKLADYLGYGWCAGCFSKSCGESFFLYKDVWYAEKSGHCEGYMHEHRLAMNYSDWGFSIKSIEYSDSIIDQLAPESCDSGRIFNNHSTEISEVIEKTQASVRSVTHITSSSWTKSQELGLSFSYTPIISFGTGGSYRFTYETSNSTTDENNNKQSRKLTTRKKIVLKPYTGAKWNLMMSKTRTSVSYTATIQIRFSLQLQGFLILGGGLDGRKHNYHYLHRGSGNRPFFNYTFGNKTVPFYSALKRESETSSKPWLWNDLLNKSFVKEYIDILTNEVRYEFKLSGKFIDIVGKKIRLRWSENPTMKILRVKNKRLKTRRPKKSPSTTEISTLSLQ